MKAKCINCQRIYDDKEGILNAPLCSKYCAELWKELTKNLTKNLNKKLAKPPKK